jgi:hypothetical protein
LSDRDSRRSGHALHRRVAGSARGGRDGDGRSSGNTRFGGELGLHGARGWHSRSGLSSGNANRSCNGCTGLGTDRLSSGGRRGSGAGSLLPRPSPARTGPACDGVQRGIDLPRIVILRAILVLLLGSTEALEMLAERESVQGPEGLVLTIDKEETRE